MTRNIMTPLLLGVVVLAAAGCDDYVSHQSVNQNTPSRQQTAWADYEKRQAEEIKRRETAWAESDEIMKKQKDMQERALKLMERQEVLAKRQEEQADRLVAILKKWEALPTTPRQ